MIGPDRWVPIKDAARGASVSESTVRRYIRDGAVTQRLGLVRFGDVQQAEADARRRAAAGRKAGGARGKWLQQKAEEFFAAQGVGAPERRIVSEFVAYARA